MVLSVGRLRYSGAMCRPSAGMLAMIADDRELELRDKGEIVLPHEAAKVVLSAHAAQPASIPP